jgi:hypothetical protein
MILRDRVKEGITLELPHVCHFCTCYFLKLFLFKNIYFFLENPISQKTYFMGSDE